MMEEAWTVSSGMIDEEISKESQEIDVSTPCTEDEFGGFQLVDPMKKKTENNLKSLRKHVLKNLQIANKFDKRNDNASREMHPGLPDNDVAMRSLNKVSSFSDSECSMRPSFCPPQLLSMRTRSKGPVENQPNVQERPIEYKKTVG